MTPPPPPNGDGKLSDPFGRSYPALDSLFAYTERLELESGRLHYAGGWTVTADDKLIHNPGFDCPFKTRATGTPVK